MTPHADMVCAPGLPLPLSAEVQDHLLVASSDLERLQGLLAEACDALSECFFTAHDRLDSLREAAPRAADALADPLARAVVALQFQDMATQLIAHTHQRIRSCADRLAADAFGSDDGDGEALVTAAPPRPNPVTQHGVDAGSIELF